MIYFIPEQKRVVLSIELLLNCTWDDTNSNFLLFTTCNDLVNTLWHTQTLFIQIILIVYSILVASNQ